MALVGKEDLVHEVAERSGLGIGEARRALEEMLGAIETQLGEGNEVRLTGFGKFSVSRRKAREGRNPQTGEPMKIAAKKVPHFSAGAELKKAVPRAPQNGASSEDEATTDEISPAKGTRKGQKTPRRSTKRSRDAGPEDEAAPDSTGAAEGEPVEPSGAGKAVSVAGSGAKYALVAAAGLAAGVAGGLAVTRRR